MLTPFGHIVLSFTDLGWPLLPGLSKALLALLCSMCKRNTVFACVSARTPFSLGPVPTGGGGGGASENVLHTHLEAY